MTPKLWLYAAIGGIILAAFGFTYFTVAGWRADAARVPILERNIAALEATLKTERANVEKARTASEGYQDELERLRTAAISAPAPVVRLCRPAAAPRVPIPGAQPRPDAAGAAGGVVPPRDGPDSENVAPRLYALADRADRCAAQLRGLHEWIGLQRGYLPAPR